MLHAIKLWTRGVARREFRRIQFHRSYHRIFQSIKLDSSFFCDIFLELVDLARSLGVDKVEQLRSSCDYEELDMLIVKHLIRG